MTFRSFTDAIAQQYDFMLKEGSQLYSIDIPRQTLWELYLASFPEGTNRVLNERMEFDCNTCKNFIRDIGGAVTIINDEIVSIWDISIEDSTFQTVVDSLSDAVHAAKIKDIYTNHQVHAGTVKTHQHMPNGKVQEWYHFNALVPQKMVDRTPEQLAYARTSKELLERGFTELTTDALQTVKELIAQGSLYKGDEFKKQVNSFLNLKEIYDTLPPKKQHIFLWSNLSDKVARFKNTVIGTLVEDITSGKDLESCVKAYESKTAPASYKRPTALITQGMINKAMETITDLGIEPALHRRFAESSDVRINNVLFADRSIIPAMKGGIGALLTKEVKQKPINISKVEEISIKDFEENVLPNIDSMEVLFKNKNINNLVSLIAPQDPDALGIMKWDNNFSWSYNGNITDSDMKAKVTAAGGRVDGAFRFTHSWNELERNESLMDLHVFMPGCTVPKSGGGPDVRGRRVGWNHRMDHSSKGSQDVDYTSAAPKGHVPVENITFPDINTMPEGVYTCKIHNWSFRGTGGKGKAEIEFNGELYQYEYPATKNHEWITVAEVTLKDGQFTIDHKLPHGETYQDVWNISTEKFHKVEMLTISPNHWDDQEIGNKHYFFILDDCLNDEEPRGFYNEFLKSDLEKHRKVFEVLGSKTKCPISTNQLSGLGFSTTQRNEIICKVQGKFTRLLKIKF